jgi:hypothetical protein
MEATITIKSDSNNKEIEANMLGCLNIKKNNAAKQKKFESSAISKMPFLKADHYAGSSISQTRYWNESKLDVPVKKTVKQIYKIAKDPNQTNFRDIKERLLADIQNEHGNKEKKSIEEEFQQFYRLLKKPVKNQEKLKGKDIEELKDLFITLLHVKKSASASQALKCEIKKYIKKEDPTPTGTIIKKPRAINVSVSSDISSGSEESSKKLELENVLLPYGIKMDSTDPTAKEVITILNSAAQNGMDTLKDKIESGLKEKLGNIANNPTIDDILDILLEQITLENAVILYNKVFDFVVSDETETKIRAFMLEAKAFFAQIFCLSRADAE